MDTAQESKHHILPLGLYFTIGGTLICLTGFTVLIAQYDFGNWNLIVALAVAAFKGSLVLLYFMHLKYDNKLFMIAFLSAILFVAIFITLTLFDTLGRGDINPIRSMEINKFAVIYDAEGKPLPMEQRAAFFEVSVTEIQEEVPYELLHGYGPIKEEVVVGPLDTAIALVGKEIFKTKCGTCHKLDSRYTGPPLRGVTVYRSATFIMNQILNPRENVDKHPDMQALLGQYYTYMTFQNVTKEDARKIVEYLRYEATRTPGQK